MLILLLNISFLGVEGAESQELLKRRMVGHLDTTGSIFEAYYAPGSWKEALFGWTLAGALDQAKEQVLSAETIQVKDYHKVLKTFLCSTRDYHVGASFYSTEQAKLPLQVKSAQGSYYIVAIDRDKLPYASFPLKVGDELILMDGKPIDEVVEELIPLMGGGNPLTDRSLAESFLTIRLGSLGMEVPKGCITIEGEGFLAEKVTVDLIWEYSDEKIRSGSTKAQDPSSFPWVGGLLSNCRVREGITAKALQEAYHGTQSPYDIGVQRSYLPRLGNVIWENTGGYFDAYIYVTPDRYLIGYLRIPTYSPKDQDLALLVKEFAGIITRFQNTTDGMVLDQQNNPGGSLFYCYALLSMLTEKPLELPSERLMITQSDVQDAVQLLDYISTHPIGNNADAQRIFGDNWDGYPVTYKFAQFLISFYKYIVEQWERGNHFTESCCIAGIDKINPRSEARYTKPLLVLINELAFSCGDLLPAVLQDNKRAKLLGVRTAGAGGSVLSAALPNLLGVQKIHFTSSISERSNGLPLEDFGVAPDVLYHLSRDDIVFGSCRMATKINETIVKMIVIGDRETFEQ